MTFSTSIGRIQKKNLLSAAVQVVLVSGCQLMLSWRKNLFISEVMSLFLAAFPILTHVDKSRNKQYLTPGLPQMVPLWPMTALLSRIIISFQASPPLSLV